MIMKKLSYVVLAFVSMSLFSCGSKSEADLKSQVDSLQTALQQKSDDYQQLDEVLTVISAGLDSISMQESELFSPAKESPKPNQEQIKKDLAHFKETLKSQRERIAQLESQLRNSQGGAKKLQNMVTVLQAQLAEKEMKIEMLEEEVSTQNLTIEDLFQRLSQLMKHSDDQQQIINSQSKMLVSQDEQMHEGYVIIGTKSELKDAGLLKGGFLSKTKVDVSSLDKNLFRTIDTRVVTEISINAKKPTILTQMPEETYKIDRNGQSSVLKILDPGRFWGVSKYLIIQTN